MRKGKKEMHVQNNLFSIITFHARIKKKNPGGWGPIDIYVCRGMHFWGYLKMLFFKNNFPGDECPPNPL